MHTSPSYDIAILGGGLAGLTAALYAARAGRSVILFEKASHLGGRAGTQETDGFYFNQGPHALYRAAHGRKILRELGIGYSGNRASYVGSWILLNGRPHVMPGSAESVMDSTFLSEAGKAELLVWQTRLMQGYPTREWDHKTLREWLDTQVQQPEVRAFFEGQFRLATYSADLDNLSAGKALDQMIVAALDGVDYIDGGWQTLVKGLQTAALAAGVTIQTRHSASRLEFTNDGVTLEFTGGEIYRAQAVISTLPPAAIAKLVGPAHAPSLQRWAETLTPVHAACLDIALSQLPQPEHQFAIGLDEPLYYSVHTRSAKLAPQGAELIQLAKYLTADSDQSLESIRQELEGLMDLFQPGWRDHLQHQRFLPRMVVTHALVSPSGRPAVAVPEQPRLFLAGDWVGSEGMLVDASFASAKEAVHRVLDGLPALHQSPRAKAQPAHA